MASVIAFELYLSPPLFPSNNNEVEKIILVLHFSPHFFHPNSSEVKKNISYNITYLYFPIATLLLDKFVCMLYSWISH